jgi:hypothetical protein
MKSWHDNYVRILVGMVDYRRSNCRQKYDIDFILEMLRYL